MNMAHNSTHKKGGSDEINIIDIAGYKENVEDKMGLLSGKIIFPDSYAGTDAQKLQSAFNDADSKGEVEIVLNRQFDITGSTIKVNRAVYGRPNYIKIMGLNGGITKNDAGFIFSSDKLGGNYTERIQVQNCKFISTAGNGTKVFDFDSMLEVLCSNNQYINVDWVAYSAGNNAQSPRFINEYINGGKGYAFDFVNSYDCVIDNCISEQREAFFINRSSAPTGVAEVDTLTITAAATASGNVTVTLNGTSVNVAVVNADTTSAVATKIAAATYTDFTASASGAVVTFTAKVIGTKTAPSYSAGATGATGSMVVTTAGSITNVNPGGNGANVLRITNCLIEGLTGTMPTIKLGFTSVGVISGNYFETNTGIDIDLSQNPSYGLTIEGNFSHHTNANHVAFLLPYVTVLSDDNSDQYTFIGNLVRGGCTMFDYVATPDPNIKIISIANYCNGGTFIKQHSELFDIITSYKKAKSTSTGTTNLVVKNGITRYNVAWDDGGVATNATLNASVDIGYPLTDTALIQVRIKYSTDGTNPLADDQVNLTISGVMVDTTNTNKIKFVVSNKTAVWRRTYYAIDIIDM